jgi:hypothetical protein
VRFISFEIFSTGVLALECALRLRTSSFVHGLITRTIFFGISGVSPMEIPVSTAKGQSQVDKVHHLITMIAPLNGLRGRTGSLASENFSFTSAASSASGLTGGRGISAARPQLAA